MKAMIWKELRENAKWGVLGSVVLALGTLYLVSQANSASRGYAQVWSACTTMTSIGSPLLAALLGLLQILPEQRRDQWAFLVHRPVSRSTIFGGKVIAGLIIYLLATGLPYGCAMLWALTPGHIAMPIDSRMAWPGAVDILMGISWYFAGMLTALRPARWYGSRALGLGAAVWGIFLTTLVANEVWQAILYCVLFVAVGGVAAWGSFQTDGEYDGQPKVARFTLGTVLYVGTVVVGGSAAALVAVIVSGFLPAGPSAPYDDYAIDPQGRVLRVHYETRPYGGMVPVSATDLNGKPVSLGPSSRGYEPTLFRAGRGFAWPPHFKYDPGYRMPNRLFTPENITGETAWFYLDRTGRLAGYSVTTKRLIGYLGPEGFQPPQATSSAGFYTALDQGSGLNGSKLFSTSSAVYRVDLDIPAVTKLANVETPHQLQDAFFVSPLDPRADSFSGPTPVAVVLENQIRMVSATGRPLFVTPLHYRAPQYWVRAYMAVRGQKYFFWYRPVETDEHPEWLKLPSYVDEVDAHGSVLNRYTLPVLPTPQPEPAPLSASLTGLAAPPGLLLGYLARNTLGGWHGQPTFANDWQKMRPDEKIMWIVLIACCIIAALASAAAAWQIGRRCAFTRREQWAWAIAVFWLGLFGLLTLLALRGWPAREVCPTCGQRRVVTREHCEHCGADFPPPRPDGTEIFDLGSLAAVTVE